MEESMATLSESKFLLLANYLQDYCTLSDEKLTTLKDRHHHVLGASLMPLEKKWEEVLHEEQPTGVILQVENGLPSRTELRAANKALSIQKSLWFYWEHEAAIEYVDREKLKSYWNHWVYIQWLKVKTETQIKVLNNLERVSVKLGGLVQFFKPVSSRLKQIFKQKRSAIRAPYLYREKFVPSFVSSLFTQLKQNYRKSKAVLFSDELLNSQFEQAKVAYVRLDFWANIKAGGSYGHTCYVANFLAKRCHELAVFMPNHFSLLDNMGIPQFVIDKIGDGNEDNLILANEYYYSRLKLAWQIMKPAFIYERICLGSYVGARLAHELNIPYIVEYNGSEITMMNSYGDGHYKYTDFYLWAELMAFKQATAISVISQVVADDLIGRGVPKDKILVNPNGADPESYAPVTLAQKKKLKAVYDWDESHVVIGFIGTFGGWHGIDVLTESIMSIYQAEPKTRFLLIGDGNYRYLIEGKIKYHGLEKVMVLTGTVPQQEAVQLLQACDIYVSPHSKQMEDSQFFGSPTKLFEYMALGGGIVASDLMQIGEVLTPAFAATELTETLQVTDQRGILCEPGNVEQFIAGVLYLVRHPLIAEQLGKNARAAIINDYSWQKHIDRLFAFIRKEPQDNYNFPKKTRRAAPSETEKTEKEAACLSDLDIYKEEAQRQWDNDPCGSHYVKNEIFAHTIEWYLDVERYRYKEYAPWMFAVMGFDQYSGKKVLEVGAGIGTDLAQFAKYGAIVTDLDLSNGHLTHAKENFKLRGLSGQFHHGDAEQMGFADESFDLVYSNGVIHHSPNTQQIVKEMWRVLKPGGTVKVMVYAENSLHYWRNLVNGEWWAGDYHDLALEYSPSMGEIMSRTVEISEFGAKPLVKVYTRKRLATLFTDFTNIKIVQRQMVRAEVPAYLRWLPVGVLGKCVGWNLILTATKPVKKE